MNSIPLQVVVRASDRACSTRRAVGALVAAMLAMMGRSAFADDKPAEPADSGSAQPGTPGNQRMVFKDLRRVEATVGDISPLDAGMRQLSGGLREGTGFQGVYQIPKDAATPYAGWFVRASGGVWAVFPQSVYVEKEGQMLAQIPPGTRYFIGGVPLRNDLVRNLDTHDERMNVRVDTDSTNTRQPGNRIDASLSTRADTHAEPSTPRPVRAAMAAGEPVVQDSMRAVQGGDAKAAAGANTNTNTNTNANAKTGSSVNAGASATGSANTGGARPDAGSTVSVPSRELSESAQRLMTDERYRSARLASLLTAAANPR